MLKSYLKVAWRNLLKDRQFTLLNLLGLSVGLACALLIGLWVTDERQMEKYNTKDARLYQVMVNQKTDDGIKTGDYTPGILAKALREEIPEIADASSVLPASWGGSGVAVFGDKKLKASPQYVDSNWWSLFTCPWLEGDRRQLYADKQGVAISSDYAKKLLGTTQGIIGKTIHYDHYDFTGDFVIRGIFEPNTVHAADQFDLLFNYAVILEKRPGLTRWDNSDPHTFVLVKPGADIAALDKKIANFIQKKQGNDHAPSLMLARFSDRYLYNHYENGAISGGRIVYVRLFTFIAAFILVIACINFMNLSTARATRRAREVGIRKVVGAGRGTLTLQYLGESLLLSFIALGVALVIVRLVLPVFNDITGKQLSMRVGPGLALITLGMTVLTGLLAGSYPAFYLSAFRPVAVLKGTIRTSLGELWARKGLVVFQFTLSVIFIAGVLIVYRQLSYIQSRDLGYQRDHLIHFDIPFEMDSVKLAAAASFVKELGNVPGVVSAGSYSHDLMGNHGGTSGVEWPGKDPHLNIDYANIEVGFNFLETSGIKLVAGRPLSQDARADKEIIFNETAIKAMGLKNPIGVMVRVFDEKREIVGVAGDFNFESLYQPVKPALFRTWPVGPEVLVRLKTGTEQPTIERIKAAYVRFNPGMPFEYKFLDEDYQQWYASEIRVGVLSRYSAGLAILIACLGLFGLAAFTAQRRRKEISIRKIVGATSLRVAYLLSKEYMGLVLVSIAIAFPLIWLGMYRWLDGFAYRAPVRYDLFVYTAISAVLLTLLTVGYQSVKAARANPAKNLRTE